MNIYLLRLEQMRTAKMVGEGSVHPLVQRLFRELSRFCGRYQLAGRAEHCTATSVVHLATDLDGTAVAIKFMKTRAQLKVEVESRELLVGDEEDKLVVALRAHTADEHLGKSAAKFRAEAQKLGYGPHGIVMEAMDRNLAVATLQESFSLTQVSDIMRAVVQCVDGLHQRARRIHGDLKQANIMRTKNGRRWKLIDMDCSSKLGQKVNTRASMAYCAPELARHIFLPDKVPCPIAHPSLDVWAIGVILFELLSQNVLFPRNDRTHKIEDVAARQQLCMWLCPTREMLQRMLTQISGDASSGRISRHKSSFISRLKSAKMPVNNSMKVRTHRRSPSQHRQKFILSKGKSADALQAPVNHDEDKGNVPRHAVNLVQWCLQGNPDDRPSVKQLLSHPFLNWRHICWEHGRKHSTVVTMTGENLRQRTHAFISHFQVEAAGEANRIFEALGDGGATGWLDMQADDLTEAGMRAGVENADIFVLLLTSKVLTRPFCLKEFEWALSANKPIVILVEEDARFFPWSYADWKRNKVWDKTNRQWVPAVPAPEAASTWIKLELVDGRPVWLNTTTGKSQMSDPAQDAVAAARGRAGTYDAMADHPAHKRIRDKVLCSIQSRKCMIVSLTPAMCIIFGKTF